MLHRCATALSIGHSIPESTVAATAKQLRQTILYTILFPGIVQPLGQKFNERAPVRAITDRSNNAPGSDVVWSLLAALIRTDWL